MLRRQLLKVLCGLPLVGGLLKGVAAMTEDESDAAAMREDLNNTGTVNIPCGHTTTVNCRCVDSDMMVVSRCWYVDQYGQRHDF